MADFKRDTSIHETECPCCNGEGGEQEAVLCIRGATDGPWYPCGYCDETGVVTWAGYVNWHYWIVPPTWIKRVKDLYLRMRYGIRA